MKTGQEFSVFCVRYAGYGHPISISRGLKVAKDDCGVIITNSFDEIGVAGGVTNVQYAGVQYQLVEARETKVHNISFVVLVLMLPRRRMEFLELYTDISKKPKTAEEINFQKEEAQRLIGNGSISHS